MHGTALIVQGGCFGARAEPAPLLWDDVESTYEAVADGEIVPIGDPYPFVQNTDGMEFATASTRDLRGVSQAHYIGYGVPYDHMFLGGRDYNPGGGNAYREMYISWYIRMDTSSTSASSKLIRFWAGGHNGRTYRLSWTTMHLIYDYAEDMGTESDPWAMTHHSLLPGGVSSWNTWDGEESLGQWHRLEFYFRASTGADTADGRILTMTDGRAEHDIHLSTWREAQDPVEGAIRPGPRFGDDPPNRVGLIGIDPSVPIGDYIVELDDIYVDSTPARIELCNMPRWQDRPGAHCELQPSSEEWSDARIHATANRGSLGAGDAWLYVVRQDRTANADGFRVRLP